MPQHPPLIASRTLRPQWSRLLSPYTHTRTQKKIQTSEVVKPPKVFGPEASQILALRTSGYDELKCLLGWLDALGNDQTGSPAQAATTPQPLPGKHDKYLQIFFRYNAIKQKRLGALWKGSLLENSTPSGQRFEVVWSFILPGSAVLQDYSQRADQKVDPPWDFVIYTIEVLESRIGGPTCWILPGSD